MTWLRKIMQVNKQQPHIDICDYRRRVKDCFKKEWYFDNLWGLELSEDIAYPTVIDMVSKNYPNVRLKVSFRFDLSNNTVEFNNECEFYLDQTLKFKIIIPNELIHNNPDTNTPLIDTVKINQTIEQSIIDICPGWNNLLNLNIKLTTLAGKLLIYDGQQYRYLDVQQIIHFNKDALVCYEAVPLEWEMEENSITPGTISTYKPVYDNYTINTIAVINDEIKNKL